MSTIYPPITVSIHPSFNLLCIYPSIYPSTHFIFQSLDPLIINIFFHLSFYSFTHPCIHTSPPSIYQFINSSIHLPLHAHVPLCMWSSISVLSILYPSIYPSIFCIYPHIHACMHLHSSLYIFTYASTHACIYPPLNPPIYSFSIPLFAHPCALAYPFLSASFHFSIYPFIHKSIHSCISTSFRSPIHLLGCSAKMFCASPRTRSRAGYCCCGNELTLIWSHRNRYLNRHLKYKINNRGLDSVFWEHHGVGGREEVASACHLLIRLIHRSLVQ